MHMYLKHFSYRSRSSNVQNYTHNGVVTALSTVGKSKRLQVGEMPDKGNMLKETKVYNTLCSSYGSLCINTGGCNKIP